MCMIREHLDKTCDSSAKHIQKLSCSAQRRMTCIWRKGAADSWGNNMHTQNQLDVNTYRHSTQVNWQTNGQTDSRQKDHQTWKYADKSAGRQILRLTCNIEEARDRRISILVGEGFRQADRLTAKKYDGTVPAANSTSGREWTESSPHADKKNWANVDRQFCWIHSFTILHA